MVNPCSQISQLGRLCHYDLNLVPWGWLRCCCFVCHQSGLAQGTRVVKYQSQGTKHQIIAGDNNHNQDTMETSAQHTDPSYETALNSPETAPLLASASAEGSRQYDATTAEPQPEVADTPEPSRQSSSRSLFILFFVLLIIHMAIFAFGVAKYSLERYGSREFGFYDYSTSDDATILLGVLTLLVYSVSLTSI